MRRFLGADYFRQWCVIGWLTALGLASNSSLATDGRAISKEAAKSAIKQAMEAEMRGQFETRDRLLAEAMKNKSTPLARAQTGLLRVSRSGWLTIDQAAAKIADSEAMKRYEGLRDPFDDTALGNWRLAQACLKARLPDQAEAHLQRVLQFDPEHVLAREALGFRKVADEWIAPEEVIEEQKHTKAEAIAVERYGRTMGELGRLLSSSQAWERERGRLQLMSLREPMTALAAEKVLTPISDDLALTVVDFLGQLNDPLATGSLTRHAMLHSSPQVRERAAQKLANCDLHAYAPPLLKQLSLPIRSDLEPLLGVRGEVVGYRQTFQRVAMDKTQVVSTQTTIDATRQRPVDAGPLVTSPGQRGATNSKNDLKEIARAALSEADRQTERQVTVQNERIAARNVRALEALRIATRANLPDDPQAWWNWYENQIGIETEGRDYTETDQMRMLMVDSGYRRLLPARRECFVAGTTVTTHRGAVAIENVRIGDMVLSKNIITGALAFRSVQQTTVREPEELVAIQAGEELLRCTKGHLFWVSGRGWTKAGDLLQGMVLHAAENPLRVDRVFAGGKEQTFNLRVADNANYFVGTARILSHDVSARGPSDMAVPGYKAPRDRQRAEPVFGGMAGAGFSGLGAGIGGMPAAASP